MIDRYTKITLTIIAAALCALVFQNITQPAIAQFGEGCGDNSFNPCYVAINTGPFGLPVRVENWP